METCIKAMTRLAGQLTDVATESVGVSHDIANMDNINRRLKIDIIDWLSATRETISLANENLACAIDCARQHKP